MAKSDTLRPLSRRNTHSIDLLVLKIEFKLPSTNFRVLSMPDFQQKEYFYPLGFSHNFLLNGIGMLEFRSVACSKSVNHRV